MSIPLVQNNEKDSINTSIIAIKRNIERINMLLGLSNSEEIDTSKFATKEELQQAVTDLQPVDEVAVDNMHSVTSNAVYKTTKEVETWSDNGFQLFKCGRVVYFTLNLLVNQQSPYIVTTVPEKYLPLSSCRTIFFNNDVDMPAGQFIVGTDGFVRLWKQNGGNINYTCVGSGCYIV